jgi:kinase suppressor of Ras 2
VLHCYLLLLYLPSFSEILLHDETPNETGGLTLYWDSWDRHQVIKNVGSTSPRPPRNRADRSSVPSEDCLPYNNNNYNNCNNLSGSISTLATTSSTSSIISLPHSSTPTHQGHAPLSPPVHQCTPPSTPVIKGKSELHLDI